MERLVAIALAISAVSMFLSCAALWPHSQIGLSNARNGFLWMVFVFVAVGLGTVSLRKMKNRRQVTIPRAEFVSTQRPESRLPLYLNPAPAAPARRGKRLELQPQRGVAIAPTHDRLYQANYQSE